MGTSDQQNSPTDKPAIKFSKENERIDDHPAFDEDYLNGLIADASKTWEGINAEEWLNEIREDYAE